MDGVEVPITEEMAKETCDEVRSIVVLDIAMD